MAVKLRAELSEPIMSAVPIPSGIRPEDRIGLRGSAVVGRQAGRGHARRAGKRNEAPGAARRDEGLFPRRRARVWRRLSFKCLDMAGTCVATS
jgi:hypothetical protein